MRVVVAMSGGVDSSVAAALMVDAGHDVIGFSMQLYDQRNADTDFGSCCSIDDLHDAKRAASVLGIPHYVINFQKQFKALVTSNFVSEYTSGRTPIPCVHCNSELKFTHLLDRAVTLKAEAVATGHYVRVEKDPKTGEFLLKRGLDPEKDQSYFLFALNQEQLSQAVFPVGNFQKTSVRSYARERGLPVADKLDSQDLCFVQTGTHIQFIEKHTDLQCGPGIIQNLEGKSLGKHDGIHRFTVGQRRGLGIQSGEPLYVLEINAATHVITVGPKCALERTCFTASNVNWIANTPPTGPITAATRIRHKHKTSSATVQSLEGGRAEVCFNEPQLAVTPGQAVVWYKNDVILGGGWID